MKRFIEQYYYALLFSAFGLFFIVLGFLALIGVITVSSLLTAIACLVFGIIVEGIVLLAVEYSMKNRYKDE